MSATIPGLSKDEYDRLQAFDRHMERFRQSTVVRVGIPHHARLEWNDVRRTMETTADVDQNAFYAFCVMFRPLWMDQSPQHFYGVSGILQRHRKDMGSEETNLLDCACTHWKRCRSEYVYGGFAIGDPRSSPQQQLPEHWIRLVLSEIHHPDDDGDRRERIKTITEVLGKEGWTFVGIFLLPNLVELLKAAMALHEAVKGLLKHP